MYLDNSTYYKWVESKTECVLTLFMFNLNPNLILVISSTPPLLMTPGWSGSVLLFHGSRVIITPAPAPIQACGHRDSRHWTHGSEHPETLI